MKINNLDFDLSMQITGALRCPEMPENNIEYQISRPRVTSIRVVYRQGLSIITLAFSSVDLALATVADYQAASITIARFKNDGDVNL